MTPSTPQLVVHDDAIRANTRAFVGRTDGRLMAVLKADGFGHGAIARSVVGSGAGSIGVATIDEALAVRAGVSDVPVLSWLNAVDADLDAALLADVDLAVSGHELLNAVSRAAARTRRRARLHLQVDVGMARDGAAPETWPALCSAARELEAHGTVRVVGVMGHMSCADRPADPQNARERLLFANAVRTARRRGLAGFVTHLAATAATITGVGGHHDLHRIGAGLFGIDPSGTSTDLQPTLSLTAPVVGTRAIGVGAGIGYGLDHVADRRTNLALLPLGYGDGLPDRPRNVPRCTCAAVDAGSSGGSRWTWWSSTRATTSSKLGETVSLFGRGRDGEPTIHDWAGWADTIEHEIVTRIGVRAARIHRTTTAPEAFVA
ncbi:alanine racemase [Curtobacterium flaccumfaciens]|nr:alanine racemase [Curtobacterium flaccumfaciens]